MSRKTLKERVDESLKKAQEAQNDYDLLLAQYNEKEEKARTKRIIDRGRIVEEALPEIITLTKTQFNSFVEKVMSSHYALKLLAELNAENEIPAAPMDGDNTAQSGGTGGNAHGGNGAGRQA